MANQLLSPEETLKAIEAEKAANAAKNGEAPPAEGVGGTWSLGGIMGGLSRGLPLGLRIAGGIGVGGGWGAATGAAGETLAQMVENWQAGRPITDINKTAIAAEAGIGAVGGGAAKSLNQVMKLGKAGEAALRGAIVAAPAPIVRHASESAFGDKPWSEANPMNYPGEIAAAATLGAALPYAGAKWAGRHGAIPVVENAGAHLPAKPELSSPEGQRIISNKIAAGRPLEFDETEALNARLAREKQLNDIWAQEAKNLNAGDKTIGKDQVETARSENAREKFVKNSSREAKKQAEQEAAARKVQAAIDRQTEAGGEWKESPVRSSASTKIDGENVSVSQRLDPPPPPKDGDGGDAGSGGSGSGGSGGSGPVGPNQIATPTFRSRPINESPHGGPNLPTFPVYSIPPRIGPGGPNDINLKKADVFPPDPPPAPAPKKGGPKGGPKGGGGSSSAGVPITPEQAAELGLPTGKPVVDGFVIDDLSTPPVKAEAPPAPPIEAMQEAAIAAERADYSQGVKRGTGYEPPTHPVQPEGVLDAIAPTGPVGKISSVIEPPPQQKVAAAGADAPPPPDDLIPPDAVPVPVPRPKGPKGGPAAASPEGKLTAQEKFKAEAQKIQDDFKRDVVDPALARAAANPETDAEWLARQSGKAPTGPIDESGRELGGWAGPERRGSGRNPGADGQYKAMRERVAQKNALAKERAKLPKAQPTVLTPEEKEAVEQMLVEMEEILPVPRTWLKDGEKHRLDNGTEIPFVPGAAGARVFEALRGNSKIDRAAVIKQLKDVLAGKVAGRNNATGENALTEARRRIASRARRADIIAAEDAERAAFSKAAAAENPIKVDDAPDDSSLLDGLIAAAEKGGYKGNLDDLRISLGERLSMMAGDEGELSDAASKLGPTWWDELDSAAKVGDDVVDVLPTGEAQPRLPEAGQVRETEVATPEMEAPFSLTPPIGKSNPIQSGELFAPSSERAAAAVPENIIPVESVKRSPLEVADAHYGAVRQDRLAAGLKSRGNPLGDGERVAGTALSRLKQEAGIPVAPAQPKVKAVPDVPTQTSPSSNPLSKILSESEANAPAPSRVSAPPVDPNATDPLSRLGRLTDEQLNSMPEEEWKKTLDEIMIQSRKGERGALSTEQMTRLAGGSLGAAYGAATGEDQEDSINRAIIFGAGGAGAVDLAKFGSKLVSSFQGIDNPALQAKAGAEAKSIFEKLKAAAPDIYRSKLLFNIPNLPINAWVGPWGGAVFKSLEEGLSAIANGQSPEKSFKALGKLTNPATLARTYAESWPEARTRIEQASSRGEISHALEELPTWLRELISFPANIMTTGDVAARRLLQDSGFSEATAKSATLTDEPSLGWFRGIRSYIQGAQTEGGKKSIMARLSLPFHKTILNQLEGSAERTPGLGFLVQLSKDAKDQDPLKSQFVQQGIGTAVGTAAYMLGQEAPLGVNDTGALGTNLLLLKILANVGGQYGLIASSAFAAGQASQLGRDRIPTMAYEINNSTPLPITPLASGMRTYRQLTNPEVTLGEFAKDQLPGVAKDVIGGTDAQIDKYEEQLRLLGLK